MSECEVNLVTAFGRGETLALALLNKGFSVRVLDFTAAFPPPYRRGPGPFPLMLKSLLPEQKEWLAEADPLSRGLAFWLPEGPIELGSPMTAFYEQTRAEVKVAGSGRSAAFGEDWLRRFLLQWASPLHSESWTVDGSAKTFPSSAELGLIPTYDEEQVMSFARLQARGHPVVSCQAVRDIQFEGSLLLEIMAEVGQNKIAYSADQWIWCLSSQETENLDSDLAARIFKRKIWQAEWRWVSFEADCDTGPWLDGLPEYMIVVGDIFLPWVYGNSIILRRQLPDGFRVWMKVPAKLVGAQDRRGVWASEAEDLLNKRLALAKWRVEREAWGLCPHSVAFEPHHRDWSLPGYRNFEWIAPETLPRLDVGARLEREAICFERLIGWRNDLQKKQGAPRDSAVHAP